MDNTYPLDKYFEQLSPVFFCLSGNCIGIAPGMVGTVWPYHIFVLVIEILQNLAFMSLQHVKNHTTFLLVLRQ